MQDGSLWSVLNMKEWSLVWWESALIFASAFFVPLVSLHVCLNQKQLLYIGQISVFSFENEQRLQVHIYCTTGLVEVHDDASMCPLPISYMVTRNIQPQDTHTDISRCTYIHEHAVYVSTCVRFGSRMESWLYMREVLGVDCMILKVSRDHSMHYQEHVDRHAIECRVVRQHIPCMCMRIHLVVCDYDRILLSRSVPRCLAFPYFRCQTL